MREVLAAGFVASAVAVGACGGDGESAPDATVELQTPESRRLLGTASLSSADADATLVVVESGEGYGVAESAHIREGDCNESKSRVRFTFELDAVSDTDAEAQIAAAVTSFTRSRHALEADSGGAHGGEYLACGAILEAGGDGR
jgi:hypothetical protein